MELMMLKLTVDARVAVREGASKCGDTSIELAKVLPLLSEDDRATVADALCPVTQIESFDCDAMSRNVFCLTSPQGGYAPLAMPTTKITPDVVAEAVRKHLAELRAVAGRVIAGG